MIVVEFYPEICCELCNEVIHNHFDCPVCKKEYAGTSIYTSMHDLSDDFSCEECGQKFVITKKYSEIEKVEK